MNFSEGNNSRNLVRDWILLKRKKKWVMEFSHITHQAKLKPASPVYIKLLPRLNQFPENHVT
jgi:hypothetical protein